MRCLFSRVRELRNVVVLIPKVVQNYDILILHWNPEDSRQGNS